MVSNFFVCRSFLYPPPCTSLTPLDGVLARPLPPLNAVEATIVHAIIHGAARAAPALAHGGFRFFSNVERLRIRLAQSDPSSPACSTQNYYGRSNHRISRSGYLHSRAPRNNLTSSLTGSRGLEKRTAPTQKLRKPDSLQLAYLVSQADSQCFHTLPTKIQQKLFSPEERRRLRNAYRESLILDAADEAFYRRDGPRRPRSSSDSTLPVAQPATVFWETDSDSEPDSDLDSDRVEVDSKMDQSLYDSVRWLDEDGDLDLSLDEYHAHVVEAASTKPKPRPRASFRRSLSISQRPLRHRPAASLPQGLPHSPSALPFAPVINRYSTSHTSSRPASRQQFQHIPKSSTATIDPTAQYYQDPDARLKLRVYLASPQKFDEAIEFGFPALDQNKENVAPVPVPPPQPQPPQPVQPVVPDCAGTFFEDDDGTMVGSPGGSIKEEPSPSRRSTPLREIPRPSINSPTLFQRRQSFLPGSKMGPQRLPGNREMTLKMTLTRPDLRTESPTSSSKSPQEDPLQLAALPPADRQRQIWDSDSEDSGVVRKMWRRIRRRV